MRDSGSRANRIPPGLQVLAQGSAGSPGRFKRCYWDSCGPDSRGDNVCLAPHNNVQSQSIPKSRSDRSTIQPVPRGYKPQVLIVDSVLPAPSIPLLAFIPLSLSQGFWPAPWCSPVSLLARHSFGNTSASCLTRVLE